MYVKRDYSSPFFSRRTRRRTISPRVIFLFGTLIGALLVYVVANFEDLQTSALAVVGIAPTPTPLPGDLATVGANLMRAGNIQAAAELFERALEQRPENVDYLHEYGQVLIEMDQETLAVEIADQILQLSPADPRGYALKARALVWGDNATAAIPVALEGITTAPGYTPLYSALARAYTNAGQYADGVDAGLLAVESDPGDVDARRSYAYSLSWFGRNDEAIDQLETALALDPNNIATHLELAVQYLAQNRDQEAVELYERVLAVQPRNAVASLRLCETYSKIGQFERAIGFCEDAIVYNPAYTQAYYQLGILRYNRPASSDGTPNFAAARDAFQRCTELNPASLDCKYRLGLSYYYLNDCGTAWDVLQESLVMAQGLSNSDTAIAHIREGLIAIGQKCPEYGALSPPTNTPDFEVTPEAGAA